MDSTETGLIIVLNQHKENEFFFFFCVCFGIITIQGKRSRNAVLGTHIPALGCSFLFESDGTWPSFLSPLVGC